MVRNCLKTETLADGKLNVFISGQTGCTADDSEQWIYDVVDESTVNLIWVSV